MADTPRITGSSPAAPAQASVMPYIWASVIIFLIGVVLVGIVLLLRPSYDPLLVITSVMGFISTFTAAIFALMKSQETHLTVNSQLTAWKLEFAKMAHAEGVIAGTATEQDRVAEQKRVAILSASTIVTGGAGSKAEGSKAEATPVEVVNAAPVKVVESGAGVSGAAKAASTPNATKE